MKVKSFEDFSSPRRKPWLLLVILLVVVVVIYVRRRPAQDSPEEIEAEVPEYNVTEVAEAGIAPAGAEPAFDVSGRVQEASALQSQGRSLEARNICLELMELDLSSSQLGDVEVVLGSANISLVMSPMSMPEKIDYVVRRGDSVERIARRTGTTTLLVQKSNQIENANLIKAGDRLRVFTGKFGVVVSKSRNDMILTMNDQFFKRYGIGSGKYGKTPAGNFVVKDRIVNPVWWRPDGKEVPYGDPENILGTHWMALKATEDTPDVRGYGIHGTWEESTIGQAVSAGCIRMRNADVEEVFTLLPLGTPVTIVE